MADDPPANFYWSIAPSVFRLARNAPCLLCSPSSSTDTSAKSLHKSLLSRGNNVGYQREVLKKRIALRDILVAVNEDLSMVGTLCRAYASQSQLRNRCGLEEADGEKVLRRFFLYSASHDKITTNCFRAGARVPNRLSSRAGGCCVGLGRRGPAGYHTGRVALMARASEPPGPAAVLPRLGTGPGPPGPGRAVARYVRPGRTRGNRMGTAMSWTPCRPHTAAGTRPWSGWCGPYARKRRAHGTVRRNAMRHALRAAQVTRFSPSPRVRPGQNRSGA